MEPASLEALMRLDSVGDGPLKSGHGYEVPSLPSLYTPQDNLRPYLEEHSPTLECNPSKEPIVLDSKDISTCGSQEASPKYLLLIAGGKGNVQNSLFTVMEQARHPPAPKLASPFSTPMATQTPFPASAPVVGRRQEQQVPALWPAMCPAAFWLSKCFRISLFMGALRPQQCTDCFCCRAVTAGSDLQPAPRCWLACLALHTQECLLQPI